MHKVAYAALPLLALLRLADPGLFGVALGVAFLFGSLMSNVSFCGQRFILGFVFASDVLVI